MEKLIDVLEYSESARHSLGETLQQLRKVAKVSQDEMGKVLRIHQSAVSRVESCRQNLTPGELIEVCRFFGVSADNLLAGSVNFWDVAKRFNQKAPFPEKYQILPFSKVRESIPLLLFLNQTRGHSYTDQLLRKLGLTNLLFLDASHPVGAYCFIDILKQALSDKTLTKTTMPKLIDCTRADRVHGLLSGIYQAQDSTISLLHAYILSSSEYESNFSYSIEGLTRKSMEISIVPKDHMKGVDYKDGLLGDTLCTYKKQVLQNFPKLIKQKPAVLTESKCHYHGAARCVYKLTAA